MWAEGSLRYSQERGSYSNPEPDQAPSRPSTLFKIHMNIILPSTIRSSKRSPSFRFSYQNRVCISLLPHTCHMCNPSHPSGFDHPYNNWWGLQIMKPFVVPFSPFSCLFLPLRPRCLFRTLFSSMLFLCSSFSYNHNLRVYRVIHKSLRDFRTRLRNNQDRHGRKDHINRYGISPIFFCTRGLGILPGSTATG